jgi:acetyl esterase/lipase
MNNLNEERKGFESLGLSYAAESSVIIEHEVLAGVDNYWFTPKNMMSKEVIVYLHGGGFIYGSIKSHKAMISHIANALGKKILYVEYSLAPEKPFPAALNETISVIHDLQRTVSDFAYGIMGDSAGGNLMMSVTLRLKALNSPLPLYQIALSPWVNLETTYASYSENEKLDPVISKDFVEYASSLYTAGIEKKNPLVSPVHGNFTGVGPTLIMVGMNEILRDDAIHLHAALERDHATSVLKVFDAVTHVWPLTDIDSDDSQQALANIIDFIAPYGRSFSHELVSHRVYE